MKIYTKVGGYIKKNLREIKRGSMNWIQLAQDRDQRRALVNMLKYLWVPQNLGIFLSS
jgi:hypothetical protein